MPRWLTAPAALAALLSLTACGSGPPSGPGAAAHEFGAAWSARDGAAVCRLLAPQTAAEVASSAKKPCPQGVLEEDLPTAGPVRSVQAWGRQAQARTAADTLFLALFDGGWRVVAAGCRPQGGASPYDCQVRGG